MRHMNTNTSTHIKYVKEGKREKWKMIKRARYREKGETLGRKRERWKKGRKREIGKGKQKRYEYKHSYEYKYKKREKEINRKKRQ